MVAFRSPFPKSHSIANDIDKRLGHPNRGHAIACGSKYDPKTGKERCPGDHLPAYQAKTPEGKPWEGYGIALKPAYEPIILAMKPRDGSFARNATEWYLAGLNIDGCRIGASGDTKGRFPANVILDEEAARLLDDQTAGKVGNGHWPKTRTTGYGEFGGGNSEYHGPGRKDESQGGASRFLFNAKASPRERNAGLDDFPIDRPDKRKKMGIFDQHGIQPQHNSHLCVKPLDLCRYISTLILPPDLQSARRLLVPYCGTGSEVIGAMRAGWDEVLGIEIDSDYIARAEARIDWWRNHE